MCIAILNNATKPLTKKTLKNCWNANNDGAGMLYVEDGELKSFKEMYNFKVLMREYRRVIDFVRPKFVVLHFRIATHGGVNIENCHPFMVTEELGFVHNGVISNCSTFNEPKKSDTNIFNERILKALNRDFIYSPVGKELLAEYIGFSKLVFIDKQEIPLIIGESKGHWEDDNWFSNYSYRSTTPKTYSYSNEFWEDRVDSYKTENKANPACAYNQSRTEPDFYERHKWDYKTQQFILKDKYLLEDKKKEEKEVDEEEVKTCENCTADLIHEYEVKVNLCNHCIKTFDLEDAKEVEKAFDPRNGYNPNDWGI